MTKLIVIGAGGYGRAVAEAALLSGQFEIVGFLDDAELNGRLLFIAPILGKVYNIKSFIGKFDKIIVAIGNNKDRERITNQLTDQQFQLATIIHPQSSVSPSSTIGTGSMVMAGATVGCHAKIGRGVIVNCGAVIEHDSCIEDFSHLGPNSTVLSTATVMRGTSIKAGSILGKGKDLPAGQGFDQRIHDACKP